jgi:hypothetical protein
MNPMVTCYGLGWVVLAVLPLDQVVGMAWGVREDIQRGKVGLIVNQCNGKVTWWEVK